MKNNKPKDLKPIKRLVIDRKAALRQIVCLDLDNTLIYVANKNHIPKHGDVHVKPEWLENGIEITFDSSDQKNEFVVIPRPGLTELIGELSWHARPVIYSNSTSEYVRRIMHVLAVSHDTDSTCDQHELVEEVSFACWHMPRWSQEQCVQTALGYQKSLGHFCEQNSAQINLVWLIDDRPDLVDFPSRTLQVPPFFGDPNDTALFELIDKIFIN